MAALSESQVIAPLLVTDLEAQKLYPSTVVMNNHLAEKILFTDHPRAQSWQARGNTIRCTDFVFNGNPVHGWSVKYSKKVA
jgi:hypothetical protein